MALLYACAACGGAAQTLPNLPGQNPTIRLTTQEVVLDMVVRDRHGHLINDLKPGEVEVFEDGERQNVSSFRNVQGKEQLRAETDAARMEASTPGVAHPLNSLREVNFVSIVFAPMALGNLKFANEAVNDFLKGDALPNTYVTVFRLDTRLRLAQPYTNDKAALSAAVDRVTSGNFSLHQASQASSIIANPGPVATSSAPVVGPTGNPLGGVAFDPRDPSLTRNLGGTDASLGLNAGLQAEAALQDSLRFADSIATGMTIMDQLRQLILSQSRLPGRKIVLYLSDGLQLPLDRARIFEAIVSDANRSGVTFYTVDTRGLMEAAARPIVPSLTQLDRAASSSAQQGALNAGRLSGAQNIQGAFDTASQMDDVQLLAVSNTQLALQELAVRTGGFAVANTNEIAKPMQQVMEEIRTHYELAYAPKSSVYDGHFRKIEVKVDRPRATVQSRKGYYALPDLNGEPVQAFEMTALTAMEVRPAPRDFPYSVSMMQFRPGPESIQCEVAFEVPVAGLRISNDGKAGTSRVQASVMALIQDLNGAVVSKVSRQLFRTVPNKDLPAFKQEKIEYAEPVKLAPGRYTLNTAVLDGEGNTVAAQRISVFVRAVSDLALSSLELVKRVEPLQSERDPLNPFEMEGRRVTLTLADEVASGKPLDLYFVVYPQRDATSEAPKLLVELMKDGKEVARMTPALPKPDATGAIPMVAELQPPAGYYDIRVTVRQGKLAAQATRALTVQ